MQKTTDTIKTMQTEKRNIFDVPEASNTNILSISAKQVQKRISDAGMNDVINIPKGTVVSFYDSLALSGKEQTIVGAFLGYAGDGVYNFVDERGNYFNIMQHDFVHGNVSILNVPNNINV